MDPPWTWRNRNRNRKYNRVVKFIWVLTGDYFSYILCGVQHLMIESISLVVAAVHTPSEFAMGRHMYMAFTIAFCLHFFIFSVPPIFSQPQPIFYIKTTLWTILTHFRLQKQEKKYGNITKLKSRTNTCTIQILKNVVGW